MMAASGVRRLKLCFVGEVQGVGFRWTTRNIANKLDLTGWVRNEWDGSVSMELQGTDDQIAKFFGTLQHSWGRFCPSYTIAEQEEIPPVAGETIFKVRF
jgi:acylphosphatase